MNGKGQNALSNRKNPANNCKRLMTGTNGNVLMIHVETFK